MMVMFVRVFRGVGSFVSVSFHTYLFYSFKIISSLSKLFHRHCTSSVTLAYSIKLWGFSGKPFLELFFGIYYYFQKHVIVTRTTYTVTYKYILICCVMCYQFH